MKDKWLLKLADDILEPMSKALFDFSVFVGDDWGGRADLSCGTTACAGGWATTMPVVRRMGLRLNGSGQLHIVPTAQNGLTKAYIRDAGLLNSFMALAYIFQIDRREALYLFSPYGSLINHIDGRRVSELPASPGVHATAQEVAAHIRRFVEWKQQQEKVG